MIVWQVSKEGTSKGGRAPSSNEHSANQSESEQVRSVTRAILSPPKIGRVAGPGRVAGAWCC